MAAAVADDENREQSQDQLAATEPALDLKVEARTIRIDYRNLKRVQAELLPDGHRVAVLAATRSCRRSRRSSR